MYCQLADSGRIPGFIQVPARWTFMTLVLLYLLTVPRSGFATGPLADDNDSVMSGKPIGAGEIVLIFGLSTYCTSVHGQVSVPIWSSSS
ncbi:uncharacterized protein B0H18DRAFT_985560 [Fomitopsis serialis]|uniref:uncharacterized protein n=1 Tax=Fomitopsis serialis TaxID=139415 RepID=UPI002007928D|nr:uncharacterized protein B0H18DRAFT_985560 [Neoantrodia serialis]KAH9932450.1 hypothetical protein B0H18DRAFT_985560 [Neoantrodia serialis]